MRVFFGQKDVTALVPDTHFKVSVEYFGDPIPGVYKYLEFVEEQSGTIVMVGEGDDVTHPKHMFDSKLQHVPQCRAIMPFDEFVAGKRGLEIGGHTPFLLGTALYTRPSRLDNLNLFSPVGRFMRNIPGQTFRGDATQMPFKDGSFDYVFASHVLEHLKNPLLALREIHRVVKPGGHIILILPFKQRTFDHRRETTPFSELKQHLDDNETELDVMEHVTPELLSVYDFSRDLPAGDAEKFTERCKNNFINRNLHVHVFDFELMRECLVFSKFQVLRLQLSDIHQIAVAKRM